MKQKQQFLRIVERHAKDNTIILVQASCGYLDFAANWLIHIELLGVTNYVVIANDKVTLEYLDRKYEGHVILMPFVHQNSSSPGRPFIEYATKEFNTLMCERLKIQKLVLDNGHSFLWSDMDNVWYRDVTKLLPKGFDFVGVDDAPLGHFRVNEQETQFVCGCLTYWSPTDIARSTLHEWHSACVHGTGDDQTALQQMWNSQLKDKLRWYIMPRQLFPSGALMDTVRVNFTDWHSEDPDGP